MRRVISPGKSEVRTMLPVYHSDDAACTSLPTATALSVVSLLFAA